ncbi:hypothetical protein ES702_01182 [subsurface metagenome]
MALYIFGMRHAQKEGDALTDFGREQCEAVAQTHLKSLSIVEVITSGAERTAQTAQVCMQELGVDWPIRADLRLGIEDLDQKALMSAYQEASVTIKAQAEKQSRLIMVADWLRHWELARKLQARLREAFTDIARSWANEAQDQGKEVHVLTVSHGPLIELLVDSPEHYSPINEGDIVVYQVTSVGSGECRITDADFLPCPLRA